MNDKGKRQQKQREQKMSVNFRIVFGIVFRARVPRELCSVLTLPKSKV